MNKSVIFQMNCFECSFAASYIGYRYVSLIGSYLCVYYGGIRPVRLNETGVSDLHVQ